MMRHLLVILLAMIAGGDPTFMHVMQGPVATGLPHNIPNFCATPTITSVATGDWSNPGTWSAGRAPRAGDIVSIASGTAVTYNVVSDAAVDCVGAQGLLRFRTDVNTRLKVGTLMVMPDGALEIGTEANPVAPSATADIVITPRPIDLTADPEQYGTGLVAFGRVRMHGAVRTPTFSRLAAEARAGATSLSLASAVTGWSGGDRIVLPDSTQFAIESGRPYVPTWETPTLTAASGSTLSVSPLQFDHAGARDGDDVVTFLPHVGSLSRNVVIRSENPTAVRGHVIFVARADVDVRYVLFKDLGRTTNAPLDSTTFDNAGRVTHVGTNQIGRYSLHLHHLMGPRTPPENGYQYTLIGNAVDGGRKWGIAIHNTHYGLVKDNVVYDIQGAGVMTEDGSESFNVIEHNFVVRVRGTGAERADGRQNANDFGYEGTAFWFHGPNNYVRDNVGANTNSFGYVNAHINVNNVRVPEFPGADTMQSGQYQVMDMRQVAVREFARNELYASVNGLTIWNLMASCCTRVNEGAESLVRDFRVWHISRYGMYNYGMNRVTFDGWVQRGDKRVLANRSENPYGFYFDDYPARNIVVRGADIQGLRVGVGAPSKPGDMADIYGSQPGTLVVEDSFLRNHKNINIGTMYAVTGGGRALPPRQTSIRNVGFMTVNGDVGGEPQRSIVMSFQPRRPNLNFIQRDEVFVQAYNRLAGNSFRVYYNEQAPDFVVPATNGTSIGAPAEGLTNQQNWSLSGIAIAGAVAPCAQRRAEIDGFVCQ